MCTVHTAAEKLRGTKVWVPTMRSAKGRAGCWVRKGVAPPAVMVRGYHPGNFCENSDAKSCILVTTCCEISCFFTALHAMQTRSSDENSVRLSVRPSVRPSVCPSVCHTRVL